MTRRNVFSSGILLTEDLDVRRLWWPGQHLEHFTSACNGTMRNGLLLLWQFVLSLKGPTFDWYTKLPVSSVHDWSTMKGLFLHHFYNTRCIISLKELSLMKRKENEKAADYTRQWRSQSLHYSHKLNQEEAVKLCMSGLHPYIGLQLLGWHYEPLSNFP